MKIYYYTGYNEYIFLMYNIIFHYPEGLKYTYRVLGYVRRMFICVAVIVQENVLNLYERIISLYIGEEWRKGVRERFEVTPEIKECLRAQDFENQNQAIQRKKEEKNQCSLSMVGFVVIGSRFFRVLYLVFLSKWL